MMGEQELVICGFTFGWAGCVAVLSYPAVSRFWLRIFGRMENYQQIQATKAVKTLDDIFMEVKPIWVQVAYGVIPVALGVAAYIFFNNIPLVFVGVGLGVLIPEILVRQARALRRRRFQNQLVDSLFLLSSSLQAGLSLSQAFETLEAEMSPPASQEFGLMMKAHRLGRPLEEALQAVNERMESEDFNLVTTAVLVAKGTGGDVTRIIAQLISTIRERKKLKDKVTTLTLQGRLQAYIMSVLPILFAIFTSTFSPGYFDLLLNDPAGQRLMFAAVCLWVVGIVMLIKLSKVEI